MKKKIAIVTKEFWPVTNGTVTCISNIEKELTSLVDVTIFCTHPFYFKTQTHVNDGLKIIYLANIFNVYHHIEKHINNSLFISKFPRLKKLTKRLLSKFLGTQTYNDEKKWINLTGKILNYIKAGNYDYALSIAMPYSNVEVVSRIKKLLPTIKTGHILFDLYKDNPVYLENDKKISTIESRSEQELNWITNVDYVFTTSQMELTYLVSYPNMHYKFKVIGLPMVTKLETIKQSYPIDKVNFVYTGNFYSDIRNPNIFFDFAVEIAQYIENSIFHLYGVDRTIMQDREPDLFVFYGQVKKCIAISAVESADVLINMSNKSLTQIPSKLYEYISSGKLIINIYSLDNDLCKSILENYPLAFSIKENELCDSLKMNQLVRFINQNLDNRIDFDTISSKYLGNTPKVVAYEIYNRLSNK